MIIKRILNDITNKNRLTFFEHELLLAHVLKKSREYILAYPEHELTKLQFKNYKLKIKERLSGVPLAYITGEKEFYGFNFKVNENVLIPRPETEFMVEETLHHIRHNTQPTTIIDVGTGSGCIIITLAQLIKNYLSSVASAKGGELKIKNYLLFGIDISRQALKTAKQNAKLNKVENRIKFVQGNLLSPLLKKKLEITCPRMVENSKIIILANLPYLTPSQIKNYPSIKHEPKLALTAGPDGLKYYRQLFKQIVVLKKLLCVMCYVLCEIDPSQKNTIKKLIKKELPEAKLEIKKDLRGHSRLVVIKF